MIEIALLLGAYMIGSIPTAVWTSKYLYGIDIRDFGSGNSGATNTFRVLGRNVGIFVLSIDILKGLAAVSLASLPWAFSLDPVLLKVLLGVAAVVGHLFPLWANFRGGKGVATLFGMIIGINPMLALMLVLVFLIVLMSTHYVSLSSLLSAVVLTVFMLINYHGQTYIPFKVFAILTSILIITTHQKNISRLLNGTEGKIFLFKKNRNAPED